MTIDVWMQHPTLALPAPRHARVAAAMDRDGGARRGDPDRRDRERDGRCRRRVRIAERLARSRGLPGLERRGRRLGRRPSGPVRGPRRRRPLEADGGRPRASPLRHRARLQGPPCRPLALERAADRPPLLPAVRRLRRARRPVLHPGRAHRPAAPLGDRPPDPVHRPGRPRLPRAGDRRRPHRLSVDRGDGRRLPASTRTSTSTPRPTPRSATRRSSSPT